MGIIVLAYGNLEEEEDTRVTLGNVRFFQKKKENETNSVQN